MADLVLKEFAGQSVRPTTREKLTDAADCLLANLLDAHSTYHACFLGVPLSTGSFTVGRYLNRAFGHKNFQRVVNFLKLSPFALYEGGFNDPKTKTGRVSRFILTDAFLTALTEFQGILSSGHSPQAALEGFNELLFAYTFDSIPSLPEATRIPDIATATAYKASSDIIRLKNGERKLIDYAETEETETMRRELAIWNDFLVDNHHVDLLLPDSEIATLFQSTQSNELDEIFFESPSDHPQFIERSRIYLYRVFNNGTFNEGGRFYGGWWQQVPSKFRPRITINERATIEYDFSSLHPAMLYAKVGQPLSNRAYEIDGIEPTKQNRKLIKTTFLKLINARQDQRIDTPDLEALPQGWSWQALQDAICAKHQQISQFFRSGIGLRLQKDDAAIAFQVMSRMMAKDVVVLPVHDSFITYHELSATLEEEMRRAFRYHLGMEVEIKGDVSLVEWFRNELEGFELTSEETVDSIQSLPGYEGYRERHQYLLRNRSRAWQERFGVRL